MKVFIVVRRADNAVESVWSTAAGAERRISDLEINIGDDWVFLECEVEE